MTTATHPIVTGRLVPRGQRRRPPGSPARTIVPAGPEPSLDRALTTMWADLKSHITVTCPVCSGQMKPRYGAGAGAVGGRCVDCGTSLG